MAAQMLGEVPATAAAARTVGSLLAATGTTPASYQPGERPDRWLHGVLQWPEVAPAWTLVADECSTEGDGTVSYGDPEAKPRPVGAVPYLIRTLALLDTANLDVLEQRARLQIESVTGQAVARELLTGELTRAAAWEVPAGVPYMLANPRAQAGQDPEGPWLNPNLADAEMLEAQPDPAAAAGLVEAVAGTRTHGTVFVHVPGYLVPVLSQYGVHAEGNTLRTALGSYLIADSGYVSVDGDGALDTPAAVYATGPVSVWVGAPHVYARPSEVVRPDTNRIGMWAERPALALFDQRTAVGCVVDPSA